MTPDDAFLHDIIEHPDDDSLRLIYADYLDERDDPRGEFIRVQVELARLHEDDPRRDELEARQRGLLMFNDKEWLGPLRGLVSAWTYRRGFVEAICIPAQTLLQQADRIFRAAPVREIDPAI